MFANASLILQHSGDILNPSIHLAYLTEPAINPQRCLIKRYSSNTESNKIRLDEDVNAALLRFKNCLEKLFLLPDRHFC